MRRYGPNGDYVSYEEAAAVIKSLQDSRRERIATAALAGLLADPQFPGDREAFAATAVMYADALIARLDSAPAPAADDGLRGRVETLAESWEASAELFRSDDQSEAAEQMRSRAADLRAALEGAPKP